MIAELNVSNWSSVIDGWEKIYKNFLFANNEWSKSFIKSRLAINMLYFQVTCLAYKISLNL